MDGYIIDFFILASYNIVVGCPTAIIQKHKMKTTQVVSFNETNKRKNKFVQAGLYTISMK